MFKKNYLYIENIRGNTCQLTINHTIIENQHRGEEINSKEYSEIV